MAILFPSLLSLLPLTRERSTVGSKATYTHTHISIYKHTNKNQTDKRNRSHNAVTPPLCSNFDVEEMDKSVARLDAMVIGVSKVLLLLSILLLLILLFFLHNIRYSRWRICLCFLRSEWRTSHDLAG